MIKFAAKESAPVDVLVVGQHPCAYFAAMLLAHKSGLRVVLALTAHADDDDRLVTLNPAWFDLHPLLAGLKQQLPMTSIYGLQFLSDQADTASEHRSKSIVSHTARYCDVRQAMARILQDQPVELLPAAPVSVNQIDETRLEMTIGKHHLHPRAMVLADESIADEKNCWAGTRLGSPR